MKVAMYHNNHKVTIEERPVPVIKPDEILVKTKACGVCVSDTMEWYLINRAPLPRGHEVTGIVERVGSEVKEIKVGDRVVTHHHVPCFVCDCCLRGFYTLCESYKKSNIYPGGFAEFFVASADITRFDTLLLPDNVSFEAGTLVEPLACVLHAIHNADIKSTDRVVLIGTGLMGILFIKALKIIGVQNLIVHEILDWRREKAMEAGAEHVFAPLSEPSEEKERIKKIFKGKETTKVIVAAKDIRAIESSFKLVGPGGTVMLFATPEPHEWVKVYPSEVFFNELTIKSSYSANHLDTREALSLLEKGIIDGDALITHKYPLEELSSAILQTVSRDQSLKCVVRFD